MLHNKEESKFPSATELLQLAKKSAVSCAEVIKSHMNEMNITFKRLDTDPVTAADKAAEESTRFIISRERPEDGFIGEEGTLKDSQSGLRWVLDPLDGTVNYTYKIPHWCFSISCEHLNEGTWEPIVGVVFDVLRNEMFTAVVGNGAFLNKQPIKTSSTDQLSQSLIATEFSYDREKRVSQAKIFSNLLPKARDIRSTGSSALDLCWVACGRFDAFYENDLKIWDWSAGSLIVREAQGHVSFLENGLIASTRHIHKNLQSLLTV